MGERGLDISEWQAGMDVERVVRENGISFVMIRTNYGSNHDDSTFHSHSDGAERAGAIVTPYVYPLASDTAGSVDDAVRIIGGRYSRCIVDWEVGSGGADHFRAAHERVWEHGLSTPVTYDPEWYWRQVGSPNVDWLGQSGRVGGRWKSWYPDNVPGSFEEQLKKLSTSVWSDGRGGITTKIVQFTSSGRLSGWGGNLDLNYFPGSHGELEALLTGGEDMGIEQTEAYARELWQVLVKGDYEPRNRAKFNLDLGFVLGEVSDKLGKQAEMFEALSTKIDGLAERVAKLETSGVPVKAEVDIAAVAKAVNDDADRRNRDGDPATGDAS